MACGGRGATQDSQILVCGGVYKVKTRNDFTKDGVIADVQALFPSNVTVYCIPIRSAIW